MKKLSGFLLSVLIAFTLLSAGVGEAYAARLGGGKSFGSRPSYSTPYSKPGNSFNSSQPGSNQASAAAAQNQAARGAMNNRGGLMGMLGGLALGGLLGAMFFGGGFEGINFMDILLFGGVAFALFTLFKLFAGRRQSGAEPVASGPAYRQTLDADEASASQRNTGGSGRAGFNTDLLFNRNGGREGAFQPSPATWPANFDAAGFLNGAKAAYAHLQQAWDQGDLAELRGLCTDKVFGELQEQIRGRSGENRTELLKVEAEILEVSDVGADREVAVLFNVVLRESPAQQPTPVREVWHFTRARASKQPTWFLDGIQQIED